MIDWSKTITAEDRATADAEATAATARAEALAYLASTDWMVIRAAETGKAMPEDVAEARAAARGEV
ncbi:hypothetical protein [Szabonella alba]|uniref:Uncharacterized protein n=1 Tax=Szabonella alba TaxID=2804194 RepID=A0A8K0VBM7_9RHOB|nr:hypothetical protein [Szabonella alba]MBL4917991.1 hypothetical protein [Szabonella alba]